MHDLRRLPRRDKWLMIALIIIAVLITLLAVYGLRQSELAKIREEDYLHHLEALNEQNRLELEKQAAEAAVQVEQLKKITAELRVGQAQSQLSSVKGELQSIARARKAEQQQYEAKLKGIVTSNLNACERWLRNCATAKRLGLRDPDAPCECR